MSLIYLDNGATTAMDPAAVEEMLPFFSEAWGNASSLHRLGARSAAAVTRSRETFAEALGGEPGEIVFTGGGSEADNLGTYGAALAASPRRRHALLFALEHPAVAQQRAPLEALGFEVETIPCDAAGICDMAALERLIRPQETALVAVMHANNEIGTVQPIAEIGELLGDLCPEAHFHVDAVQSFTKERIRVRQMGVSSLALAGHKLHGPKGVGLLWLKKGARVRPIIRGGGQESGRRAGTENVPGIVGFAAATRLAMADMAGDVAAMRRLRERLFEATTARIDRVQVNGHRTQRLCNNVNLNFLGARAEILLHALEARDIYVSSGSACHAGQTGPSAVLKAIGRTESDTGSLRITLSRHTTGAEVDACIDALEAVIEEARRG